MKVPTQEEMEGKMRQEMASAMYKDNTTFFFLNTQATGLYRFEEDREWWKQFVKEVISAATHNCNDDEMMMFEGVIDD